MNEVLIVIAAIFALIFTLWSVCVWDRVQFAVVLMGLASEIIADYHGVIWLSLGVMALQIAYIFCWSACIYAYFWYIIELNISFNFWIFIALLISLFWGIAVNRNISHTTTWYMHYMH